MAKLDYYEALGLKKGATDAEIKSAYRKKAKELHPDVNKGEDAHKKFTEVQEAYEVLSNASKKQQYDQFGHDAPNQGGFGGGGFQGGYDFGNMSDIFESVFSNSGFGFGGGSSSRKTRGDDRLIRMNLEFEEAIYGATKKFTIDVTEDCPECSGAGGFGKKTCPTCSGAGTINEQRNTMFGAFVTKSTCPTCNGSGSTFDKTCGICRGKGKVKINKEIKVDIPSGVDTGNQLRVPNKGETGYNGGPNGDLYIEFVVKKSPFFKRDLDDIYIEVPLTISEAVLGTKKVIPTLYGTVTLNIPAGSLDGTKHKLKEKGIKNMAKKRTGDMYAIIKIIVPEKLSKQEKLMYEQLEKLSSKENKAFKEFDKYIKKAKKVE